MERTHETRGEGGDGGIDLVVFGVGALRFAVVSKLIRSIADPADTPETQAPALADLLGLARPSCPVSARTHGSRERLVRFRHTLRDGAQDSGMRIEEPVSLRRVPIDAIHPLPALVEALSALPCVRGLVALSAPNAEDFAILLDPRRLPEDAFTPPGSCKAAPAWMIGQRRQES
ncbi:hypothetical protein [Thiocapsa roseopersicina]|uniref:Uncharacterized protein n=1 Tax=Thiocapsa roseopersicina TaxID=1058 RepID=A0A1H2WS04_THIRO|nr:hypothetical protein [Thiocapsa roseopersicina]SDW83246.1 hypothetical protein SAMN05421783_10991 [Thiocapsa roseopersicina]